MEYTFVKTRKLGIWSTNVLLIACINIVYRLIYLKKSCLFTVTFISENISLHGRHNFLNRRFHAVLGFAPNSMRTSASISSISQYITYRYFFIIGLQVNFTVCMSYSLTFHNHGMLYYAIMSLLLLFSRNEGISVHFLKLLLYGDNYALSCESSNFYAIMLWERNLLFQGWYCTTASSKTDGM